MTILLKYPKVRLPQSGQFSSRDCAIACHKFDDVQIPAYLIHKAEQQRMISWLWSSEARNEICNDRTTHH
jgi:hypothetical protein